MLIKLKKNKLKTQMKKLTMRKALKYLSLGMHLAVFLEINLTAQASKLSKLLIIII